MAFWTPGGDADQLPGTLGRTVTLFFAALNIGGIQLPIVLKLDSSLSGVLQETLVLFVLPSRGRPPEPFQETVG